MPGNRAVTYLGPGKIDVQNIDYPKLQNPEGKTIEDGVILRIVSTKYAAPISIWSEAAPR
jgi:glutathione-independent formaldehyde dehydrogenase